MTRHGLDCDCLPCLKRERPYVIGQTVAVVLVCVLILVALR